MTDLKLLGTKLNGTPNPVWKFFKNPFLKK